MFFQHLGFKVFLHMKDKCKQNTIYLNFYFFLTFSFSQRARQRVLDSHPHPFLSASIKDTIERTKHKKGLHSVLLLPSFPAVLPLSECSSVHQRLVWGQRRALTQLHGNYEESCVSAAGPVPWPREYIVRGRSGLCCHELHVRIDSLTLLVPRFTVSDTKSSLLL